MDNWTRHLPDNSTEWRRGDGPQRRKAEIQSSRVEGVTVVIRYQPTMKEKFKHQMGVDMADIMRSN